MKRACAEEVGVGKVSIKVEVGTSTRARIFAIGVVSNKIWV
jgi:hypothetical protein